MNKYDDIINLPHYEPKTHPRMSIESRSAQFAPFSALTGYEDAVEEAGRLTEKRIEITTEKKNEISNKILYILENKNENPIVMITYFIYDSKKSGGKYINKQGVIKRVDKIKNEVILEDKTKIPLNEIVEIDYDIFNKIMY